VNDIEKRLVKCFQAVFPDMPEAQTLAATQELVEAWDSLATVTLFTVIDDEFRVELDVERLAEMTSYRSFYECLTAALQYGRNSSF
jgi:acyl carrier protein